MLGILRTIRKRHAIRRYMAVLPAQLRKDFGHRGPYTPGQVESAIVRSGRVSSAFLPYAIAIFCDAEVLKTLKLEGFEDHNLGALRSEVADRYFDGDVSFEARDVGRLFGEHGGQSAGDHAGASDGGGHGGHGDGGGGHH